MNAMQKEALRASRVFLVENIEPGELFDHLIANRVFTPLMLEHITCQKPRSEQVRTMLRDLERRNYKDYEGFIKCLNDTHQEHCAEKIRLNQSIVERRTGTSAVSESSTHQPTSYKEVAMRSFGIKVGAS